jgi:hypothetical protein
VDGVADAPLERVRPDGRIVFDFELGSGVVEYCLKLLHEASPVLTGAYRNSHTIYADGAEVETAAQAIGAEHVVILSTVPYARKIEGANNRPAQSMKAPKGVYEVTAAMANKRFGNVAAIKFTFEAPLGGSSAIAQFARAKAAGIEGAVARRREESKLARQPAISIRFR